MTRHGPQWDPGIWEDIREAMRDVVSRGAVCRQFLPKVIVPPDQTTITKEELQEEGGYAFISQNDTIPIVEIFAEFRLTAQQVEREDTYHEGRGLAVRLAHDMARAEDCLLLGLNKPDPVEAGRLWPKSVKVRDGAFEGLLERLVNSVIGPPGRRADKLVGDVEQALTTLRDHEFYGPYALVLTPVYFADARSPIPGSLVLPIDLIARDAEWILRSRLLEDKANEVGAGVVISIGGNSLDLVISDEDYAIMFVQVDPSGRYVFRVSHRLALRIKRSMIDGTTGAPLGPIVPVEVR